MKRLLQLTVALVLLGGLVVGALNFDAVKSWAAKHYLRVRFQPAVIAPEDNPDLFAELSKWHNPEENLNLLLIGIDRGSVPGEEGYTRSDVMIVASVNVKAKRAVLVSIPRDTKVTIPGYGTEKINAAHSFKGPAGAVEAVEKLSGLDIHHYAEVDFEAFKNIVDAMGGVPFHLDVTINDPKVGYLEKGDHLLNGQQALILVRSRKLPRGDLDRIEHQKAFLKAVMEKAVSIRDIQALLKILDTAVRYLETTLEPDLIFTLAEALQGMKVEDVEFATIPGTMPEPAPGEPWYFIYDQKGTAELFSNVKKYCSTKTPEERQAELEKQELYQRTGGEAQVDRSLVNLAVLNGVRWEGMAAKVAEKMREKGYKNIKIGNTVHAYEDTTVYYAPGFADAARVVAKDLDPDADFRVVQDQDVAITYDADVILVIGKDYLNP
ncbi:LCP family protein [Candidatus Solincola tengchongensis]|uniref:LCP family protein n=1 Tax=Candidatus Solincola tengchongensis TaxID=2900693 RepID=UPI00257A463A|nr:LCP family protein [Candidatus Solincola tengchongensis]